MNLEVFMLVIYHHSSLAPQIDAEHLLHKREIRKWNNYIKHLFYTSNRCGEAKQSMIKILLFNHLGPLVIIMEKKNRKEKRIILPRVLCEIVFNSSVVLNNEVEFTCDSDSKS